MSEVYEALDGFYDTPEAARYASACDFERTVQLFAEETRALGTRSFATAEEAHAAGMTHREEWLEEILAMDVRNISTNLQVTGEGVFAPNFRYKQTGAGVVLHVDRANSIRPLAFGESLTATLSQIDVVVYQMGESQFNPGIKVVLDITPSTVFRMANDEAAVMMIENETTVRAFTFLSEGVHMQSVEKNEIEDHMRVEEALAKSGILKSRFVQEVDELGRIFDRADPTRFIALGDIDILKRIAHQGVLYAKQGVCSENILLDKLMQILKTGRALRLIDTEDTGADESDYGGDTDTEEDEVQAVKTGKIDQVFFKHDENDQASNLCISLLTKDEKGTDEFSIYHFDKLTGLQF